MCEICDNALANKIFYFLNGSNVKRSKQTTLDCRFCVATNASVSGSILIQDARHWCCAIVQSGWCGWCWCRSKHSQWYSQEASSRSIVYFSFATQRNVCNTTEHRAPNTEPNRTQYTFIDVVDAVTVVVVFRSRCHRQAMNPIVLRVPWCWPRISSRSAFGCEFWLGRSVGRSDGAVCACTRTPQHRRIHWHRHHTSSQHTHTVTHTSRHHGSLCTVPLYD